MAPQLKQSPGSFPFDKLVECNIGNPQALQQQPPSFSRQVLALMSMPSMMDWPEVSARFAPDAIARAKEYLAAIPEGLGAYSESMGFRIVREQVAEFITRRDGIEASPDRIFLTDGASKGVQQLLKLVLSSSDDGVLVPVPQYPLYSASLSLEDAHFVGYELGEAGGWTLPIQELEAKADAAKASRCRRRRRFVLSS